MSYAVAHRGALGATAVSTSEPRAGRPQPPIYPLIVGTHGGFLQVRRSPADGACGVHGYPCQHPGVDVNGPAGTPVHAPEDGIIIDAADGSQPPWRGYGPWLVLIKGSSGLYHLLAHLDLNSRNLGPIGLAVSAGDVVGKTSTANHTHWEVRKQRTPPAGQTNQTNNLDPITWLARASGNGLWLLLAGGAILAALIATRTR